jgi:cellobiose phosphorylase
VWSVISGAASDEQATSALNAVHERLATQYGLMLCAPPYEKIDYHVMRAILFNTGQKENAGIFCHPQGWAVIAECMTGKGDRAYEYYRAYMPSAYNDRAEIRESEPYVHAQSTHSKYSRQYGASRLPWLSGTAAWSYYAATNHILGFQPQHDGVRLDPCIPSSWNEYSMSRLWRGKTLNIKVSNPNGAQKGVKSLTVNGVAQYDNFIAFEALDDTNEIEVTMGQANP